MKTKDIYSPSFNKINVFDCKNKEYDERKYKTTMLNIRHVELFRAHKKNSCT